MADFHSDFNVEPAQIESIDSQQTKMSAIKFFKDVQNNPDIRDPARFDRHKPPSRPRSYDLRHLYKLKSP
jgi:hypothetical protein